MFLLPCRWDYFWWNGWKQKKHKYRKPARAIEKTNSLFVSHGGQFMKDWDRLNSLELFWSSNLYPNRSVCSHLWNMKSSSLFPLSFFPCSVDSDTQTSKLLQVRLTLLSKTANLRFDSKKHYCLRNIEATFCFLSLTLNAAITHFLKFIPFFNSIL